MIRWSRWRASATVFSGALLALLTACAARPDCERVINHAFRVLQEEGARVAGAEKRSEEQKKSLEAMLAVQKVQSLAECKTGQPPLTMERQQCILAAKSEEQMKKCGK